MSKMMDEETRKNLYNYCGMKRDLDGLREILRQHPDAARTGEERKWTPLHVAASEGTLDMVKALVSAGASFDLPDVSGVTPLIHAAAAGKPDIVRYLLDLGADIHHRTNSGGTALIWAAMGGRVAPDMPETIRLLLYRGSDIEAKTENGEDALQAARDNRAHYQTNNGPSHDYEAIINDFKKTKERAREAALLREIDQLAKGISRPVNVKTLKLRPRP